MDTDTDMGTETGTQGDTYRGHGHGYEQAV
jgi:hypothetical protein